MKNFTCAGPAELLLAWRRAADGPAGPECLAVVVFLAVSGRLELPDGRVLCWSTCPAGRTVSLA